MLDALSPLDGRYENKIKELKKYFSEASLIKYRVLVEIKYFIRLADQGIIDLGTEQKTKLLRLIDEFGQDDAQKIKDIEKTTNHDVKAVEYWIKDQLIGFGINKEIEFVHFALTSQDINNTAFPLMIKTALEDVIYPNLDAVIKELKQFGDNWSNIPMLARTHGQPASPTALGKEFLVFVERLEDQFTLLKSLPIKAKFGGATGNFNAHKVSFPEIDWITFANDFVTKDLGLTRSQKTTQIAHYDHLSAIFMCCMRIDNILIDYCRDLWTYISMDYFKQKTIKNEVGSSAMPHKVNPIDFENAEGNLGVANALFGHLANKLPISRLQRDLTDSTVLRNVGVPFGHLLIALKSIKKGNSKLMLNEAKINADLEANWAVVAEAIQNILRREGFEKPYELLKALTRGKASITKRDIHEFIETLNVKSTVKEELLAISPFNYIGYH